MADHRHPDMEAKLSEIGEDVAVIKVAVLGENGIPRRVRSLENWRAWVAGAMGLLLLLSTLGIALGAAVAERL